MRSGRRSVASKGSIEGLLRQRSSTVDVRAAALLANDGFTERGMRLVAVAGGVAPATAETRDDDEAALRLLGLLAFSDPVRAGVDEALAVCRRAGLRVVMVTGDHPATAEALAVQLGLVGADDRDVVATGDDLDRAAPDALDDLVARTTVFARASSSIVLLDDDFTTIVGAVRDGRRIFDNLTRAFGYLIAFHPPLLMAAIVVPLIDRPLLLEPVRLVVLELVLHPVESLVFQADPAAPDTMDRPPRPVGTALRPRALARPYAVGSVLGLVVVAVYLSELGWWPEDRARALGFATLLASQPLLLLSVPTPGRPLWRSGLPWTRTLRVVLVVLCVVTVAVVHVPAIARVLHLSPFPGWSWLIVLGAAATVVWFEPFKRAPAAPRTLDDRTSLGKDTYSYIAP